MKLFRYKCVRNFMLYNCLTIQTDQTKPNWHESPKNKMLSFFLLVLMQSSQDYKLLQNNTGNNQYAKKSSIISWEWKINSLMPSNEVNYV